MTCPVVIYQMGKVGSISIRDSLRQFHLNPLHLHRYYWTNNERNLSPRHLFWKTKYNITLDSYLKKDKVKIITIFRDPLSRNISSYFENLDVYFSKKEMKHLDFDTLKDTFNNDFRFHITPNTWFDQELYRKTGINIFDKAFQQTEGYVTIEKENISLFACTTDKINALEKELGEFLNISNFKIQHENSGTDKWYSDLYKEFKNRYKPSEDMLNLLYDSDTIKYFYSAKSINKLRSKWLE